MAPSQLPGTELAAAWPAIPRPHQDRVVSEAGEMLAALLHVHSNLPECLSELPAPPEPTLDSLALTWFGTA